MSVGTLRTRAQAWDVPLGELTAVAVLTAAAGLCWSSTFSGRLLLPGIVAAAVLHPALVAAAGRSLLRRQVVRLAVGVEVAAVGLALALGGVTAALRSLQRGWGDLLTTSLPVDTGSRPFGLALAVTWAAGFAAAELVLMRGRTLTPLLPPLLALAVALAVGAPAGGAPLAAPGAMILAGGVLVALRSGERAAAMDRRLAEEAGVLAGSAQARLPGVDPVAPPRTGPPLLRLAAGAGVAVAVALLAVAVGPALPGVGTRDRFDIRRYRSDPVVEREAPSPLLTYAGLLRDPLRSVATVRGGAPDLRLRLATLDAFDGSTWTSTARYTRASTTLPGEPGLEVPTDQVTLDVEVGELDGPFLPAPDRPVRVDEEGMGVDPTTGVLLAPDGVASGRRYRVTSAIARRTATDLRGARQWPRTGGAPPGLPSGLREQAEAITSGAASSFGKPAALLRHFEDPDNGFTTATKDLPGGHGYFALTKLFKSPRSGTDEQYASAVAVLSRTLGYESRMTVGFRLPAPGPDGLVRVQGRDAHVWAEIRFEGVGWIPLEVRPPSGAPGDRTSTPSTLPNVAAGAAPAPPAPDPLPEALQAAPADSATSNGTAPRMDRVEGRSAFALAALTAGVLILLVVAGLGCPLVVKAVRRRRRRRATDPKAAVLGAWADALDGLVEHGGHVQASMSAAEVVAAAPPVAVPPLSGLAGLANVVRFDPTLPSSDQAASAWAAADAVRSALRGSASLSGRLRAAASPAPLLRRT